MTATIRITVTDNDGPEPEYILIVDHEELFGDATEHADRIAEYEYARTGVVPRFSDGTPYWGDSDEQEVNG